MRAEVRVRQPPGVLSGSVLAILNFNYESQREMDVAGQFLQPDQCEGWREKQALAEVTVDPSVLSLMPLMLKSKIILKTFLHS